MQDFSDIKENYKKIAAVIPENVQLVAVSKTHPAETVQEIYNMGQNVFGENKVQELVEKQTLLPKDIQWHLIGHLQTNKVKYIAPFVDTIQSVDSEKILKEINKQAAKNDRKINVLLQVKIAAEDTKFGFAIEEAEQIFQSYLENKYPHVEINGLMGMATFTENKNQIAQEFKVLKDLFDKLSVKQPLAVLSMGMSDDYPIAIESGANSVRIGSSIFGRRNYDV